MTPSKSKLVVLLPRAGESWDLFLARLDQLAKSADGTLLVVLAPKDRELVGDSLSRGKVLARCSALKTRLLLATKEPVVVTDARKLGLKVIDRLRSLRTLLKEHPQMDEAVRLFSPHTWRQELKTRLQRIGLLSLPTLRIYLLVGVSIVLFGFVVLKLLPSAEIRVWPREEPLTHTINVFLSDSGALVTLPPKIHTLPLVPIKVTVHKSIAFSDISKQFIGTSAQLPMKVVNNSTELYGLKKGTRFTNQAGMVFLLDRAVTVAAGAQVTVPATAADTDIYREIIGDRGNVPQGLKWDIPGLPEGVRPLVYGINTEAGKGGTTGYRTVLQQQDIDAAKKRLEQELLTAAKQLVEQERQRRNAENPEQNLQILSFQELTRVFYEHFVLPTDSLGQPITNITAEGDIQFKMFSYDSSALLELLKGEILTHVRDDKQILLDSLSKEHMDVRVISYDDNFTWIKLTVELTGTQEYILDPLSANGALFGKRLRERVAGKVKDEALRIIRNMPEVDRVEIHLWPPWGNTLPSLPANISISPQKHS